MAAGLKTLARVAGSGALVSAYTCPASLQAVTSQIIVQALPGQSGPFAFRFTVRLSGSGADSTTDDVWDDIVGTGQRTALTEAWALTAGDAIYVNAPTGVVVRIFGREGAIQ